MSSKIRSRLNYVKAELWQAKFSEAEISLSSIITAKFRAATLWKAQFWSHQILGLTWVSFFQIRFGLCYLGFKILINSWISFSQVGVGLGYLDLKMLNVRCHGLAFLMLGLKQEYLDTLHLWVWKSLFIHLFNTLKWVSRWMGGSGKVQNNADVIHGWSLAHFQCSPSTQASWL